MYINNKNLKIEFDIFISLYIKYTAVMSRILYMKSNLGNIIKTKKWESIVTFKRDSTWTSISFKQKLNALGFNFHEIYEKSKESDFLLKRLNTLSRCYIHPLVLEKYNLDDKIAYAFITLTTSPNIVDYGNNEKFKPVLLYTDPDTGRNFYTTRLIITGNLEEAKLENLMKNFYVKDNAVRNIIVQNSLLDLQLNTYKKLDLEEDLFSYIKGFKNIHKPDILQTNTDIYIIKKLDEE